MEAQLSGCRSTGSNCCSKGGCFEKKLKATDGSVVHILTGPKTSTDEMKQKLHRRQKRVQGAPLTTAALFMILMMHIKRCQIEETNLMLEKKGKRTTEKSLIVLKVC
jgi:hypothetical protein